MKVKTAPKSVYYVQLRVTPTTHLHLTGGGSDRETLCGKSFETFVAFRDKQTVCNSCIHKWFEYMEGIE